MLVSPQTGSMHRISVRIAIGRLENNAKRRRQLRSDSLNFYDAFDDVLLTNFNLQFRKVIGERSRYGGFPVALDIYMRDRWDIFALSIIQTKMPMPITVKRN